MKAKNKNMEKGNEQGLAQGGDNANARTRTNKTMKLQEINLDNDEEEQSKTEKKAQATTQKQGKLTIKQTTMQRLKYVNEEA